MCLEGHLVWMSISRFLCLKTRESRLTGKLNKREETVDAFLVLVCLKGTRHACHAPPLILMTKQDAATGFIGHPGAPWCTQSHRRMPKARTQKKRGDSSIFSFIRSTRRQSLLHLTYITLPAVQPPPDPFALLLQRAQRRIIAFLPSLTPHVSEHSFSHSFHASADHLRPLPTPSSAIH